MQLTIELLENRDYENNQCRNYQNTHYRNYHRIRKGRLDLPFQICLFLEVSSSHLKSIGEFTPGFTGLNHPDKKV